MPVIVFLLDNSASMNQMTHVGTTLFDMGKGAIEQFLKIRQRDASAARTDRYMLLTLNEPPSNVKVGWKEPMTVFASQLKSLDATGLTQMGSAIKQAFDLLNLNRHAADYDTYGCGRFPHLLESALIIVITDKQKLTSLAGVQNEINIPMNTGPLGSELTKEPFRWDQRLFAIVLALPATPSSALAAQAGSLSAVANAGIGDTPANQFIPAAHDQPITAMCDVTGGRSYLITTQRALLQCLESLVQKIQAGVVVNLEKVLTEGDTERCSWYSCRKMIMLPRTVQKTEFNWPIPEEYWPTAAMLALPPRSAHALIKFQTVPCEVTISEKFPFDKYELEPSPLTQYILERRQPSSAWQVFVQNSSRPGSSDLGSPFGYLKASSNLASVNLYVLPYNYPELFILLDELTKVHRLKATKAWQNRFDAYLRSIPAYYHTPLRRALARRPQPLQFVFDSFDKQNPGQPPVLLSPQMLGYLKKIRFQAKAELDRWPPMQEKPPTFVHLLPSRPDLLFDKTSSSSADLHEPGDDSTNSNFLLQSKTDHRHQPPPMQLYLNVFDIPRNQLLDVVMKLRRHLSQKDHVSHRSIQDDDALHSVPIKEMSNYDEYPRANGQAPPLRDIDAQPVRQHVFGNPFKVNKPIDEIDEFVGSTAIQQPTSRKRQQLEQALSPGGSAIKKKRTTLVLKNYVYRRHSSGGNSGPSSPASSTTSADDDSDTESVTTSAPRGRFSFDIRSVFDDDRRRLLKKYREAKKQAKLILRRQVEQELFALLDTFTSSNEIKLTLIDELIHECRRLYPRMESRLVQYRMHLVVDSASKEDEPSSSSSSSLDDYSMIDLFEAKTKICMSTGIGKWGDRHDDHPVGPARRSFDQEYDKTSAFEYSNRSFARPQPWRSYPVLGGETGDELDTHPLIKEQRDKLLPNKSLNPEYNRFFDERQEKEDGRVQVREDHLALFSPHARKVILFDMGLKPGNGDLDRDYQNDPRYRVLGLPYFIAPYDARVVFPIGFSILVLMRNMYLRRPYSSARPVYAAAIAGGFLFGSWWRKYRQQTVLEKELAIWDYVRRHPEDFPEVFEKRRQYKEIFQSWRPLR